MESHIKEVEVLPAPTTIPEVLPIVKPQEDPDEDDPWTISPQPLVDPTPKG